MTKADLYVTLKKRHGYLTNEQVRRLVRDMFYLIVESFRKGESVTFAPFGSWKVVESKSRLGRHPKTGRPLFLPGRRRVKFYPGKQIKDAFSVGRYGRFY